MSLAVVQCPACRGSSRVDPEAIGQMVCCPRCDSPFVAEEDIPIVQPLARPPVTRAGRAARAAVPVAPPRRSALEAEPAPETSTSDTAEKPKIPDPEHDPHLPPVAGLPVTVLVGLALLPFGIPLLWWVAPLATGKEAALSMAVPVCLAIAAAALCLGVVYTIDWTAATRIKGVLMLVGLSYLSAAGLYFLKKDMMDRVRSLFGAADPWIAIVSKEGNCVIQMPGEVWADNKEGQPLLEGVKMADVRRAQYSPDPPTGPSYSYCFGVSQAGQVVNRPDDGWFRQVGEKLKKNNGEPTTDHRLTHLGPEAPGWQWTFPGGGNNSRVVQVFAIKGRVYYLSAEGPKLTADDDEYGRPFFDRFDVNIK